MRDHAADTEDRHHLAEKRLAFAVEPEHVVSKQLADVEKITRPAAKIENAQWRCAIERKVLAASNVDTDPVGRVFEAIYLVGFSMRKPRAQARELADIDLRQNFLRINRMRQSAGVFPKTRDRILGKQVLNLPRKPHRSRCNRRADTQLSYCRSYNPNGWLATKPRVLRKTVRQRRTTAPPER